VTSADLGRTPARLATLAFPGSIDWMRAERARPCAALGSSTGTDGEARRGLDFPTWRSDGRPEANDRGRSRIRRSPRERRPRAKFERGGRAAVGLVELSDHHDSESGTYREEWD
jgi:hypothetical protein